MIMDDIAVAPSINRVLPTRMVSHPNDPGMLGGQNGNGHGKHVLPRKRGRFLGWGKPANRYCHLVFSKNGVPPKPVVSLVIMVMIFDGW